MKIRGFFALCIFRIRSRIEVVHESAAIRGKETLEAAFLTESGKSPAGVSLIATAVLAEKSTKYLTWKASALTEKAS